MTPVDAITRLQEAAGLLLDRARQIDGMRAKEGRLARQPNKAVFPPGLFRQTGRAFVPYVLEMQQGLQSLAEQAQQLSIRAVGARLDAFENQFTALNRAIRQHELTDATGPAIAPQLRAVVGRYRPLYDKLKEYKEYERRLDQKIRQLKNDRFMTMQHQAEILRQYQRLGRCRQAITELEERLEALEAAWRQ